MIRDVSVSRGAKPLDGVDEGALCSSASCCDDKRLTLGGDAVVLVVLMAASGGEGGQGYERRRGLGQGLEKSQGRAVLVVQRAEGLVARLPCREDGAPAGAAGDEGRRGDEGHCSLRVSTTVTEVVGASLTWAIARLATGQSKVEAGGRAGGDGSTVRGRDREGGPTEAAEPSSSPPRAARTQSSFF